MVDDHRAKKQAMPIMKSFSEGLPFTDYWNTLYGARAAAVDKQLQTSEPGAFNKDIMATAVNQVVSNNNSHTQEGIDLTLDDKSDYYSNDLEDRFLARDVMIAGKVVAHSGDRVTSNLLGALRASKAKNIRVMSPLTDMTANGISGKSYGITEKGGLPEIGDNVGAISGQAMSEPLTQMTMRTFHQGGISGTRGVISGYEAIDKLLKMHEIKRNKAVLAPRDGKVTKVESAPGGVGTNIYFDGVKDPTFVEIDAWDKDRVRVGGTFEKGDILSKGIVQPQELVKLKGMLHAQNYVVGEIHKAYKEQGINLKRRAIETVVRAAGNTTKIIDPGDSSFLPGDVAPWVAVQNYNNQNLGEMSLDEIDENSLLDDIPGTTKGEPITDRVKDILKRMGKNKVTVGPKKIKDEPFLSGIERVPMLRDDWMSQMGYRELANAIVSGAARLSESDLHGYAPVPAFAYGAEFGDAKDGRSKKEGVY
jgi:DNA-directed RNA polymerase subunit beta'